MNKFSQIIKKSNFNIHQLSKKTGIPNQNLYSYANGTRSNPSLETAFKIADALNIDINELRDAFREGK